MMQKTNEIKTLYYFSNEPVPSPMACTIQQMRMCQAFRQAGLMTTFVRPWYFSDVLQKPDPFAYYDIETSFDFIRLPSLMSLSKPGSNKKLRIPGLGGLSLMWSVQMYLNVLRRKNRLENAVIYSRNLNATLVALNTVKHTPVWFEAHTIHEPLYRFRRVLKGVTGVVTISSRLTYDIRELIPHKIVITEPDGVDEKRLNTEMTRDEARSRLGLDDRFIAVYTGKAFNGKGVDIVLKAASKMPHVHFVLVGPGPVNHLNNVTGIDFVAPSRIHLYQAAADVLLLPNTETGPIHRYTSPLKLFEYMAANRPIVASNMPVFRDVLKDKENALLFEPGNPLALVQAIESIYTRPQLAEFLSRNSRSDIRQYTFQNRAGRIIKAIENNF